MANERLAMLREKMEQHEMDAYYIPSSDFHDSEYVDAHFKCRAFVSGFTGSAGTLVVTKDFAGLWTDGRYFVQAKKELEGQDIELMKMGEEGIPTIETFLKERMPQGGVLGFDGRVVNTSVGRMLENAAKERGASLRTDSDLAGMIWDTRPELPAPDIWIVEECYVGESAESKIARVRQEMKKKGASVHLISDLSDIAWLLNIRKRSEDGNLLSPAHVMVREDALYLYIDNNQFEENITAYFADNGVTVEDYHQIYDAVANLHGEIILLEAGKLNYALYSGIPKDNTVAETMNPTSLMKAMKNPVEMENLRKAHIRDGVALTKFICWLKQNVGKMEISETQAAEQLEAFRREQEGYLGSSFDTISAYGANAAMCHYHATKEEEAMIEARGLYLVDSGGQYYEGTTDVTRTIVVGPLRDEERLHFTLVLMGMLRLSDAKFLYGCRGMNLDYLARGPLWQRGLDFNHGTGHGVGFISSVHERPNGIRWRMVPERQDSCVLEDGMFTSNEPGLYIEGSHGIRTENLILCHKAEKNLHGQYMCFETLTFAPIDLEAVDISVMEPSDVRLLNAYHKQVYEKLSPYLTEEEQIWLKDATREIGGDYTWSV